MLSASEQPARVSGISTVLRRVQQLGGLGHEMHAGQHDHIGIHAHRLARQRQAVAHDIGDAMENFRRLVIMRQDHRVALALQRGGSPRYRAQKSCHSTGGITRATLW